MRTARSLLSLALPLLVSGILLLTQQVSATHALQHTLANHQQQEKSTAHTHHCDLCALDVQLGSTLHSSSPILLLSTSTTSLYASPLPSLLSSPARAAQARGPPAISALSA